MRDQRHSCPEETATRPQLSPPHEVIPVVRTALFYSTYFGVLGLVLPFLGPYLDQRGIGAIGVGLITAAFSVPRVVYTPLVAAAVDKGHGRIGLLTAHLSAGIIAAVSLLWVSSPLYAGAALLVVGAGYGTVLPLVETAILSRLPTQGYGVLRLWGSAGFVVVSTCGGWLLAGSSWVRFPILLAGSLLVLTISCLPFEQYTQAQGAANHSARLGGALWTLLALLTLHQVSHGAYYAFFSLHLTTAGYGAGAISLLWSCGVVAEVVAFLRGDSLQGALGLKALLGWSLALTPLRWLLLALPLTTTTLVLAQCGHAVTFALVHLAGIQLVQRLCPPAAANKAQALYSGLTFGVGMVAGSALAGPLYDWAGGQGVFAAATVLSVLVFLLWLGLVPRLER